MPPFPEAINRRESQFSGSHNSIVMLDLFDVGTCRAIRQISAETTWNGRPHDLSLSARVIFVPAETYCLAVRVALKILFSGEKSRHFCRKSLLAPTNVNESAIKNSKKELMVAFSTFKSQDA